MTVLDDGVDGRASDVDVDNRATALAEEVVMEAVGEVVSGF